MNVDVRGQHRHDDRAGALGHLRHLLPRDRGGCIDHDMSGVGGYAHLPGASHAVVALERRDAVYEGLLGLALLEPAGARALGIIIGEQGMVALTREVTGEIGGYRRFTRAPFRVQDENALHWRQSLRRQPRPGKYVTALTAPAVARSLCCLHGVGIAGGRWAGR